MPGRRKKDVLEHQLSRRERQIMGAIYRLGKATVAEIVDNIPDPPTQDAIRRMCHILADKGLLKATPDGPRKVYSPTINSKKARHSALDNVIDTFFGGSPGMLVASLLENRKDKLSAEDLERLTRLIEEAGDGKDS